MKRMIYDIPLATLGILMNAQKVKVGFWDLFGSRFYDDLVIYEGSMGGLMFDKPNRKLWDDWRMRKVNHLSAEGDVVVIGIERFER